MAVQKIGRYRVLRELGRGSAAIVYQGRDPDSGKQVALKVFYTNVIRAEGFAERFQALMPTVAALGHPYLVPLLDWAQEGGDAPGDEVAYYLVQRYMPGGSLAERMDGRPMLLAEVVPILQRLAEALDAAHTAGLLHGAVNPGHVLFDLNSRAFLADLGLALLLHDLPMGGAVPLPGMPAGRPAGLPAYWSPEQITGLPLDGRADVYALGVMVYEMLTGRQPYVAEATGGLLLQHLEAPVPRLSEAQLAQLVLPAEFNHVLARALAKNRDARYATAGILAEAMRAVFLMAPGDLAALDERAAPPPTPLIVPTAAAAPTPAEPPAAAPEPVAETAPEPAAEGQPAATAEAAPETAAGDSAPAAEAASAEKPAAATAPAPAVPAAALLAAGGEPPEPPPPTEAAAAPMTPEPAPAAHPHSAPVVVPLAPTDAAPEVSEWTEAPDTAPRPALPGWSWIGGGLVVLLLFWMVWRSPTVRAIVNPPTATPTPTATLTPTLTATITPTPSATPTATNTPTATVTASATSTRRPTITPSPTISATPSITPTVTQTATFIPTWTSTPAPPTETSSAPSAPLVTATP